MSMFSAIGIAQSGIGTYKAWVDATADNIANANNKTRTSENAFQARRLIVESAARRRCPHPAGRVRQPRRPARLGPQQPPRRRAGDGPGART